MLGKKQSEAKQRERDAHADRMAKVIVVIIQWMQKGFAGMMTKTFEKMGRRYSIIVIAAMLLTTGVYSFYLIGKPFLRSKKEINVLMPSSIRQPNVINEKEDDDHEDTVTSMKMKKFLLYFDSLQKTRSTQYDSILQSRPGLIDSIRMLEQILLFTSKK